MRFYYTKIFAGAVSIVGGVAGGAAVTRRYLRLAERQGEIAVEGAALQAELAAREAAAEGSAARAAADLQDVAARDDVLTSLWTERHRRYADALERNRSVAELLPEATRVVRGLAEHYKYTAEELPRYYRFDMIASKVHASGLALALCAEGGRSPRHVLPALRFIYGQQPVVSEVAAVFAAETPSPDHMPRSLAEVDLVFRAARRHLSAAVDEYEDRLRRAAEAAAADTPRRTFFLGAVWAALGALRLKTEAELAEEEAAAARLRLEQDGAYRLQDKADVVAAINHVDGVLAAACTEAARGSWAADELVVRALTALDVWAEGAERLLADEQTLRLLAAHQTVLESGLLAVNKPKEATDEGGKA